MHTVVRGAHNAKTPFYLWHTVRSTEDFGVYTKCGLWFGEYSIVDIVPFSSRVAKTGDRCETNACGLPH